MLRRKPHFVQGVSCFVEYGKEIAHQLILMNPRCDSTIVRVESNGEGVCGDIKAGVARVDRKAGQ